MLQTITIYLGTIIVCTLLADSADKRNNKRILLFAALLASVVAGVRSISVGNDTAGYYRMFLSNGTWGFIREPIFGVYIRSLMFIFRDAHICLLVTSTVTQLLFFLGFWKLKDRCQLRSAVFAYMAIPYFLTFSGIRQWLSLSIVMFAIPDLLDEKYKKYIVLTLVATMFHYSTVAAFSYIVIYRLLTRQYNRTVKDFCIRTFMIFIGIASIIIAFPLYVGEYSNVISELYREQRCGAMMSYFRIVILLFSVLNINSIKKGTFVDDTEESMYNLQVFTTWGFSLWTLAGFMGQFYQNIARVGWMFLLCQGLLFSNRLRRASLWCITRNTCFLVLFVYSIYSIFVNDGNQLTPYIPFWIGQ